ncbi:BREX-1 system adenine-specific DNA-methyltransferase PglX [Pseudomonas sp. PDM11]|uniref:BREX-1 system adenine-specific DNA-methyltransferase PglX n=1 Tax=Pseudomonas sp. PDM11 TaxID=2769309 RepID=UPI0017848D2B|nr:BREX-1 system adenine-specific DNA-methyltransferase PglX [Pseudomonas sp. PDM11]MBD9399121.1 BREX-1 system adenine-specific DNA-methyltransferase PglX [Pseudomonas sp. PDM11]
MNRSALKKYAPQARLDFIEAVTLRARRLGLDPTLPVSVEQKGDVLLIAGQPFPASVAKQRSALAQRIQQQGFSAVVEALAYTWFNRLVAVRFMELKGYLSHGYRVLSHPEGQQPEILEHAQHLDLPGLDKEEVIRLKTAGNQDEALYREILLAQCHELHRNMPFLFEALDDATELLLPDNLLRTDSLIARLVSDIEEADWQEVEVIGWLYQFYISDKKDEVIGKVVKSEDIPAATQLFTPNWIVQYLVQNSLGRLWLMANPGSNLKDKMPYYIEPAEQAPEVQAQLDALIKVRMDEDGGTLNPESLTVLDPACGSGHILVEAYNLLRAIYEERGYRLREIPRLILQKNLYGLDIDDRAAQLASFALLMKAREDDRRLFDDEGNPPHLNVMAIQQSAGLPDEEMARVILNSAIQIEGGDAFPSGQLFGGGQLETQHSSGLTALDFREVIKLFENGNTFGSLITVPNTLKVKLGKMVEVLGVVRGAGDSLSRSYASQVLEKFVWPAGLLSLEYDAVVLNPPYLDKHCMNGLLKSFGSANYSEGKFDLYSMFMLRGVGFVKSSGLCAQINMQGWMFSSSFQKIREYFLREFSLRSLIHLGARAFEEIDGEVVQTACWVVGREKCHGLISVFVDAQRYDGGDKGVAVTSGDANRYLVDLDNLGNVPGSPMAYWVDDAFYRLFSNNKRMDEVVVAGQGLVTGDNSRFVRLWFEVSFDKTKVNAVSREDAQSSGMKWFPYNKGGAQRRWFGNLDYVVDWEADGASIKYKKESDLKAGKITANNSKCWNQSHYFLPSIGWSGISSGAPYFREYEPGAICSGSGLSAFFDAGIRDEMHGYLNTSLCMSLMRIISPGLSFTSGEFGRLPYLTVNGENKALVQRLVALSKMDWNSFETSWGFEIDVLVKCCGRSIGDAWQEWSLRKKNFIAEAKNLEERNNKLFIDAYGLQGKLSAEVEEESVSLARADRQKDSQRLISYVIGCMTGRYSLDEQGLIYAHGGGIGFDPLRYQRFFADEDGIIPITEESWFEDDTTERLREFVKVVWGDDTLVENMEWLADSLGRKAGESADDAIRRYLSTSFYKDHLQTYKKRPIYWLFSSGKQKAFECLVYLHRYNEGTLSRMRMEYVVPLQSRMQARIDKLTDDIDSATSSAQQKALQKRKDKLTKQLEELRRFDENLRPYADQRITLDLDDGVKVNYGKFGNLLAEVKAITGGKEE